MAAASCCFCPAVICPVRSSTRMRRSSSSVVMVRKCCSARISVGTISAHCRPLSTASSMASRATTVLPEPTSPCSRRFIGCARRMSPTISRSTRFCAAVSSKGRRPTRSRAVGLSASKAMPGAAVACRRLRSASCSESTKNSSKIRRSRAAARRSPSGGRWMISMDSRKGSRPSASITSGGYQSRSAATCRCSVAWMSLRKPPCRLRPTFSSSALDGYTGTMPPVLMKASVSSSCRRSMSGCTMLALRP